MPDPAQLIYAEDGYWFDIGHDVWIRIADDHGHLALIEAHPPGPLLGYEPIGGWCYGSITTRPDAPKHWDLISRFPLHVEPSLLCGLNTPNGIVAGCGHHGFIRKWKWVPA